jgi:RNA polymerase sigma-32 factor
LSPVFLGTRDIGSKDEMVEVSKLDKLSLRERRVLEARVLADKPMTLEELAEEFGVARERVRQLEVRVREKMGADISVNQRNS